MSDTLDVTVDISDVNDVTPTLSVANLSPVNENSAFGTAVASFTVTDPDTNNNFSYVLTGPDATFFNVSNGKVVIARNLDFEASASRTFTLTVDDGAGHKDQQTVTIAVTDVNEAPVLTILTQNTIEENSPGGTVAATFSGDDPDAGDTVTFSLAGADAALYEIVGDEIRVRSGATIDYETKTSHSLILRGTDSVGKTTDEAVSVVIAPVSEFDPILTVTPEGSIEENSPGGTLVATFSVSDADDGEILTYTLSGDDAAKFVVSGNTVVVAPDAVLDFETDDTLSVILTVTDSGDRSDSQAFDVILIDVPENPDLTVTNEGPVDENSAPGTLVATFSAVDPDPDATLTYSLDGTHAGLFEIVGNEVHLRSDATLNFEAGAMRTFDIRVVNDNGFEDVETVTLVVNDVHEAPILAVTNLGPLDENSPPGTAIASFTVSDEDFDSSYTAALSGPDEALFEVVGTEVRLKAGEELDYEQGATRSVTLTVTDDDGLTSVHEITLALNPINEFAPNVDVTALSPIAENSPAGTTVATFSAVDQDAADSITTVLSGTDAALFEIDGNAIKLRSGATLDYEAGATRTFDITVTDEADNTVTETVTLILSNRNEFTPTLTVTVLGLVDENSPAGTAVASFAATDPDAGDSITYHLSGPDSGFFEIVGTEVRLRDGVELNFEDGAVRQFSIEARDTGNRFDLVDVTLAVNDINDAPKLTVAEPLSLDENTTGNPIITTFTHLDEDGDAVTFALTGDNAATFEIVGNEIRVRDGVTLDFETQSDYAFNLVATDANGATDVEEILFALNPISEFDPLLTKLFNEKIEHNAPPGTLVREYAISDDDLGEEFTFAITGDDIGILDLVDTGNSIRVVIADGQTTDWYDDPDVNYTITDSGGRTHTLNDTLQIISPVDTPPEFAVLDKLDLYENASAETPVLYFYGTDNDQERNLVYTLGGRDADKVEILHRRYVRIADGADIDFETTSDLEFTITVTDLGGQSATETISIPILNVSGNQTGDGADNFLIGTKEEDTLRGQGGDDILVGKLGNNTLEGDTGDGLLVGDIGDDLFVGGAGIDTVDFGTAVSGVTADLGSGADTSGEAGTNTLNGIENLTGSAFDDTLTGDVGAGDDTLIGNGAGYTVIANQDFEDGDASGWKGATTETGSSAFSTFLGRIAGGDGSETVSRTFAMDATKDYAIIEFDMLKIDSWDNENATIYLNGREVVTANWHQNRVDEDYSGTVAIDGMTVAYHIEHGALTDADFGGANDQTHAVRIVVYQPEENLTLGFGTDTNSGITDEALGIDNLMVLSSDNLNAGIGDSDGDDILTGGAGGDTLDGGDGDGDDTLTAGGGLDFLSGGAGDDMLLVAGADLTGQTISGGAGEDTVVFSGTDPSAVLTGLDGIETLDFATNDVTSAVTLTAAQVVAMTDSDNEVVIELADGQSFTLDEDPDDYSAFDLGDGVTRYFVQTDDNGQQVVAEIEVHA